MQARLDRLYSSNLALVLAALVGAVSMMTGCGGITLGDPSSFTAISASSSTIRVNEKLQLKTHSQFNGVPLTFYVNGVQGGNSEVGTISSTGLYIAPAIVPIPNSVTITSYASSHPDYPPGSVSIAVLNPIPIISSVTPSGLSEGTTQVEVGGSQFVYGAQVFWNGAAVPTAFVSGTELAAFIPAPNPGTFPLLVSNPDPGSAKSAILSVVVAPGQVVITLQPNSGTDVRVRNALRIDLTVTGTNNTGVSLQVNGIPGGNAQIGTAVSNQDGSITYVAPPVVPTPSNVVQLTVTSVDNPAVSVMRNISVLNPIPILNSATPMLFNPGPPATTVVLNGQDFISGAQVLVNGAAAPTTFNKRNTINRDREPCGIGQSRFASSESKPRPGNLG